MNSRQEKREELNQQYTSELLLSELKAKSNCINKQTELDICDAILNRNYAAFSGWFVAVVTCFSAILMQASRNGNDLWLSFWVDTTGDSQSKYSTTFYLVRVVSSLVGCLITVSDSKT